MPIRNLVLLVVTAMACLASWAARERDAQGRRFGEVLAHIDRAYLEPVDGEAVFEAAVDAAVSKLDEHSAFIRGDDRRDLESLLDQEFGGVGLELAIDEPARRLTVVAPVVGSPAWRAGILAGDRIEAIDDAATVAMPLRDAVKRLRGRPGEPVRVRVVTPAAADTLDPAKPAPPARDIVLVREVVKMESVLGDRRRPDGSWDWMLEDDGAPRGVAIVRITSFGEHTADDLAAALAEIEKPAGGTDRAGRLRGLVLDLRGNPGGLLSAAVEVCDQFLDEGVIVSTRGRGESVTAPGVGSAAAEGMRGVRRAAKGAVLRGVPLAVLVDGLTASAAEIVAACLQDHRRATIVGSRTFGKGTVQSILPLSDGRGLLKLTTSEYLRPGMANIHRRPGDGDEAVWGVSPDRGFEIVPTAASVERLRRWRRDRDLPRSPAAVAAVTGNPGEVDPVLAASLPLFSTGPAAAADLGRQKEAAGDADDAGVRGE
jgi:carboxyl-terminal processing protease